MIEQDLKKPDEELVCTLALTWRSFLWIVWGAWWRGLSFYAVVVVPIGTELIGSGEQGFITQRVTMWHNYLAVLFVLCLAGEAYRRKSRVLRVVVTFLTMITIALLVRHRMLSTQMDFQQQSVHSAFYAQHAVYLWITAAEWILGMAIPFFLQGRLANECDRSMPSNISNS